MDLKRRNILHYRVHHKMQKLNSTSENAEKLPSMETVTPATGTVDA